MTRLTTTAFTALSLLTVALIPAGCASSTDPAGEPGGDMDVELRNFTTTPRTMGLQGGPLVTVTGNTANGTPRLYRVTNPGVGSALMFVAATDADTLTASCSVTSATNVSEPPQVVVQPGFGVLECVSW